MDVNAYRSVETAQTQREKENAFVTLYMYIHRCIYRERKKEHSYLFVMQGERKIERGVFVTPPVSCN